MKLRTLLVAGVWLVILAIAGTLTAVIPVKSDLSMFLPEAVSPSQQLLLGQLREGPATHLILIALEGAPPETLAKTSQALAERLRENKHIASIVNGAQELGDSEKKLLFENRYFLSPAVEEEGHFAVPALRQALSESLERLILPIGTQERKNVVADPTGEFPAALGQWTSQRGPNRQHGVWFTPEGDRALLIARTRASAFDVEAQAAAQEIIQESLRAVAAPEIRMRMTGPGMFAVAARETIQQDSWRLSLSGTTAVALLLLAAFRSLPLLFLSLLPLASGVMVGAAAVGVFFGYVHAITLAFGVTLIGMAGDYPIHLFAHKEPHEVAASTLARIWPTIRLGVLTTIISYFAMMFSGFTGLAQLGVFTVAGLVMAALVTRWLLPPLVDAGMRRPLAPALLRIGLGGASLARHFKMGFAAIVLVAAGYLFLARADFWQNDLASLSPVPEAVKRTDRELRGQLGVPDVRHLVVVVADTAQGALARCETVLPQLVALAEKGAITGHDAACRYLPSFQRQHLRQAALPDAATLRRDLARATSGLPFKKYVFEPFFQDIERARTARPLDPQDLQGSALGLRLETLLYQQQGTWILTIPLHGVNEHARLAELMSHDRPGVFYLDLKRESEELVTEYRNHALMLWGFGAIALVVVLALGLRSIGAMLRVLVPVLASLVVVCAVLLAVGQPLSLFHLVSLLLVVGVGIDYGLFFNRPAFALNERRRTAAALLLCSATTVIVFGALAFSRVPVLVAIGTTVAVGAAASLLMAMAFSRKELISI